MPRARRFPDLDPDLDLVARLRGERGSASLEFLTVGLLLLVPLVYLVLAISAVQSASQGVEGAARHAARVAVVSDAPARAAVERAVLVAVGDYGIDRDAVTLELDCGAAVDCREPGARVRVDVVASVSLPLVPEALGGVGIGTVIVEGSATQTVSRFGGGEG